jgi:hypothetical protein
MKGIRFNKKDVADISDSVTKEIAVNILQTAINRIKQNGEAYTVETHNGSAIELAVNAVKATTKLQGGRSEQRY